MDIRLLTDWNTWWENRTLLNELVGENRPQYKHLVDSIGVREITIITGVRRSGKSTLLYQMIRNLLHQGINPKQILFVNFDDKKLLPYSLDEVYQCYLEFVNLDKPAYIFLDEVHRQEGWESWIRKKYDLKAAAKFVVSGSCSYLLKKEYSTLLTGRNITFEVFPLSFAEFIRFKGLSIETTGLNTITEKTKISLHRHLREYLTFGGFPEVLVKPENYKTKLLEQYFDDILYKDIIDRYNLNSQITKNIALFFMTNMTGLISLRTIRNSLQISYDTIKNYLAYFKEAFLFFTLDHFSYSFTEQKTLPSKIYCIDTGLRNAVRFVLSEDEGKGAENIVFLDLKRRNKEIFYWKKKGEVDFVIKHKDQSLTAINVTYTNEVSERETKALQELQHEGKGKIKEMIIITKDVEKKEQQIQFIPLWKWLLRA